MMFVGMRPDFCDSHSTNKGVSTNEKTDLDATFDLADVTVGTVYVCGD